MTRSNSNAGRLIKLCGAIFFLVGLVQATLWSFYETERFFILMTPEYATWMAVLFSLGPLVCFGISRTSKTNLGILTWNGIGILFNLVDLATNIAAFNAWWNTILAGNAAATINGELVSITDYFGYGIQVEDWTLILGQTVFTIACILVTWSEECASYVVGYCFQLVYEMFPNAPNWIATDIINFAYGASGAYTAEQAREWWHNRQAGNTSFPEQQPSHTRQSPAPRNPYARKINPMPLQGNQKVRQPFSRPMGQSQQSPPYSRPTGQSQQSQVPNRGGRRQAGNSYSPRNETAAPYPQNGQEEADTLYFPANAVQGTVIRSNRASTPRRLFQRSKGREGRDVSPHIPNGHSQTKDTQTEMEAGTPASRELRYDEQFGGSDAGI